MTVKDVDLNAVHYKKNSKLQQGLAQQLLDGYHFDEDAQVLDVGCGDGRLTAEIACEIPRGKIIGIDASPNMIALGKASFPKSEFPNLDFKHANAEKLSFSTSFDNIVSFSCFHWVRKPKKALQDLIKMLKPGGELLMLTYPKESMYYEFLQEALEKHPKYSDLAAYHTMLSIEEYKKILKENGVELIEFYSKEMIASYKNKKAIKDYIKGWLTSFVPLPEPYHDEYLDLAIEKSLGYHVDMKNDMINLPYTALILIAKKK
jgi:ubiquinone/menaquinone biosynthesis C-methylase UbiE